jgi:EAL domain-containing protein (putative c-di-GMP-specific phosphodiesterase class I)
VAEGVENAQTYERLRELGCDFAQGFYLARPMPSAEMALWIERSAWKLGA